MKKDCPTYKPAASGTRRDASNKPPTARTFYMSVQDAGRNTDAVACTLVLNSVSKMVQALPVAKDGSISRCEVEQILLRTRTRMLDLIRPTDNRNE